MKPKEPSMTKPMTDFPKDFKDRLAEARELCGRGSTSMWTVRKSDPSPTMDWPGNGGIAISKPEPVGFFGKRLTDPGPGVTAGGLFLIDGD